MATKTQDEQAQAQSLPEGFELKTVTTKVQGVEYAVEVLQATSLEAILAALRQRNPEADVEALVVAQWNSGNEQGAKQGAKSGVREALEKSDGDASDEAVADAIAKHQDAARRFVQGSPREGAARHESGVPAKKRKELGDAMALEYAKSGRPPSEDRFKEICDELGIDPTQLS